jgi:hypothetical protein
MEKWIRKIQKKFLDNEQIKCVGLDIEYMNVC